MTGTIPFLTGWTIDLGKIPKYPELEKEFQEQVDYQLAQMILAHDHEKLTVEVKHEFRKLVKRVSERKNTLAFQLRPRYGVGRRYPEIPCETLSNGRPNPKFKRYYSALIAQPRIIKNTLFQYQGWTDLDQQKGHPTILLDMAEKNGITLNAYKEYLTPGNFDRLVTDISAHYSVPGQIPINQKTSNGSSTRPFMEVDTSDGSRIWKPVNSNASKTVKSAHRLLNHSQRTHQRWLRKWRHCSLLYT
jgi:hypothetical protein